VNTKEKSLFKTIAAYIPQFIVEELIDNPHMPAEHGQFRYGTLVFADVSGFTTMSEKLAQIGKEGAEELTDILNRYFTRMLDIAFSYGGYQLKFGGDAMLLLFLGHGHVARGVRCALKMQEAMRGLRRVSTSQGTFELAMSIGINTGEFFDASIGSKDQRLYYYFTGREVNRVAEIESLANAGEVLISRSALNELAGSVRVSEERQGHYLVKSLGMPVRTIASPKPDHPETESKAMIDILAAYLPRQLRERIQTHIGSTGVEGEHRRVTTMFINLLGMTNVVEKFGKYHTSDITQVLHDYLSIVDSAVTKYDGMLVGADLNTIGDKLLIVFGAPIAHEDDDERAIRCALDIQQQLAASGLPLQQRIGINTGYVFSGEVGSPLRREYTVMGDHVNLAARTMGVAREGEILVGLSSYLKIKDKFVLQSRDPVMVKGKSQPVEIFSVEGTLDEGVLGRQTSIDQLLSPEREVAPILGREAEIGSFRGLCREAEEGSGRAVVISGEAGMGKSRLLLEFQKHLQSREWTVYSGICYSHTAAMPFAPWIQVLNSLFELNPADTIEARSDQVLAAIKQFRPGLLPMACLINSLLGVSIAQSDVVRSLDNETRRLRLFELISTLLQAAAANSPTAIILEDLHLADHSSLELVNYISARLQGTHLLLCITYRPKTGIPLSLPSASTVTFDLAELPSEAAMQLVKTALGKTELPEHFLEAVLSKARGNPLFLEEVAESLTESGRLEQVLSTPLFRLEEEMASLEIPDRLQGLIMARIDTLKQPTREVLRAAAVIGNTFDTSTLSCLLDTREDVEYLEYRLQELSDLDFIGREGNGKEATYRFRHSLIQEVAYDSLLFARRRELHHRVAFSLEETDKSNLEPLFEVLLHHYSRSRDYFKTQVYAVKSAQKARMVFATEEAIDYYRRGLDAIHADMDFKTCLRSYFLECIGDCHESSGYHEEAARTFQQALRQWRMTVRQLSPLPAKMLLESIAVVPTRDREAALCHKISVSHERNSDYNSALKWLESALRVLPPRHPLLAAKIDITKSVTLYRKGQYEEAVRWGQHGLSLAWRSGDKSQHAYAHNMLAASYLELGKVRKSVRHRHLAVRLCEEVGDLYGQSSANNNLGLCYLQLGDLERALFHFKAGLEIDERIGHLTAAAIKHINIGEALLIQGHINQAIDQLRMTVETYERTGDPLAAAGLAFVYLSRAYQKQRQFNMALESLERGIEILRKAQARGLLIEARLQEAELRLEMGNDDFALSICERALSEARHLGAKMLEARGLRILGRIHMSKHLYQQAQAYLRQSADMAQRLGADYERGVALLHIADLHSRNLQETGSRRQCRIALRQATSIFRRMGAAIELSQTLHLEERLTS